MEYTVEILCILKSKQECVRDSLKRYVNPSEPLPKEGDFTEDDLLKFIQFQRESILLIHQGLYKSPEYERVESRLKGLEKKMEAYEIFRRALRAYGSIIIEGGRG